MHRAFCSFNDDEYKALEAKAKKLGMSTSKLIEYATTLFLDMPRTETPNVKEIRKKIEKYLEKVKDETFICSTPFGPEWARMTTSAKALCVWIMNFWKKSLRIWMRVIQRL